MNIDGEIASAFERGVQDYFSECHRCRAHEKPHQLWLGTILARHISMFRILAEYDLPNKDISAGIGLKTTGGVVSYDLCIARQDRIDARKFWTRSGHRRDGDEDTTVATLHSLEQISIIAELKTATSATSRKALRDDLLKLCGAMRFLKRNGATEYPTCFLVVFDPQRTLPVEEAWSDVSELWPNVAHPIRLVGP